MPYCIQCGKEVVENARFCYHCGASVPTTDVAAAPVLKTDPPAPNMQEAKTSGKRNAPWRTVGWICLAVITTMFFINLICSMAIGVGLLPNESRAKQFAEQEVEEAWQDFDEDLELKSISFDTVLVDEWDDAEIAAYIAEIGSGGITDVNGTRYDTYWDYWKAKAYDPYTDTYRIFTVKGNYHVTDHRKADYRGWYCITILHSVHENCWRIIDTELELPDDLKQYLPN